MNNYCTLFNINYLTKGLAMISSLSETARESFHIYVLAMDMDTLKILKEMNIKNVTVVSLDEFENIDLLRVKKERSLVEYCWTCTPAIIIYVIQKYNLSDCTYVDADLYFFNHPEYLLDEVKASGRSVLITPHHYSIFFDQTETSGVFCVQFMFFKNNQKGMQVLRDWYQKCIAWCFAYIDNGKFGDQKYLDVWPIEFPDAIHILNSRGAVGPWNVQQLTIGFNTQGSLVCVASGKEFPVVFYHFHGFNFIDRNKIFFGWYPIDSRVRRFIYAPYVDKVKSLEQILLTRRGHTYRRDYVVDKEKLLARWIRKKFLETFYFIFKITL